MVSEGMGVSGFLACRIHSDDEQDTLPTSSHQLKIRSVEFDMKDESRGNKRVKERSSGAKGQVNRGNSPQHRSRNAISLKSKSSDSSSWPYFPHSQDDEDYIVFCFREDGAFDVEADGMSESLDCFHSESSSSLPIHRKLCYDEVAETIRNSSPVRPSSPDEYDDICLEKEEVVVTVNENDEQQSSSLDGGTASGSRTQRYEEVKEIDNAGTVSAESNDSNRSDGSAGSFSFPVLQRDFMGSPAQMPKAESLQMKKHKVPCARFQCFRF